MYSNETIQSFLRRCRKRIDEELDAETNFWTPAEMLEYANEGAREVWQATREEHQNWFVRQMRSTDGIVNIGGRNYDTSLLRLTSGIERLKLPPDFYELLLLEGLRTPEDTNITRAVIFEYANMTQRSFREDNAARALAFDPIITSVQRYHYDVVYGAEGPYVFLAPSYRFAAPFETQIAYLAMPAELLALGTFEGTGFTTLMVDAILAYTLFAAVHKEGLAENVPMMERKWNLKRELAVRAAGPKQTRDEETVEGYLETEIIP